MSLFRHLASGYGAGLAAALAAGLALFLVSSDAFAGGTGGEYAPIVEGGVDFHTGTTGQSLTGAMGYDLTFRSERRKGAFRPSMAMKFEYAGGSAAIGSATTPFTMFGAGFLGGVNLFIFTTGRFQPFLGGSGVLAWNYLKQAAPQSGAEPQTEGLSFGYMASAGVDMRFGSADGDAFRVSSGFWQVTSSLGGQSGFQLNGFVLSLGLVY